MKATILQGHALDRLGELPDESVQCCVTSPPYWGLRDYGIPPSAWPDGWLGCFGLEPTPELYTEHAVMIFREVRRVLRKDGTCWINLGDCYATGAGKVGECQGGGERGARWAGDVDRPRDDKRGYRGERLANGRGDEPAILRKKTRADRDGTHAGKHTAITGIGPMTQPNRMPIAGLKPKDLVGIPWRVAFALQADGWWLRRDIIWHKPNPMPESALDRCTTAHEYIFHLSKSEKYYYDNEAIREDVSESTHARLSQDVQEQIGSIRANGGTRPDRPMKAVGRHNSAASRKLRANPEAKSTPTDEHNGMRKLAGAGSGIKNNDSFDAAMAIMPDTRNKRSVWKVATQSYSEAHFATYPEKLIEPCILAGTKVGDTVLDPFGGSGTTGVVALRYHRNAILIEIKPDYAQMQEKHIHDAAPMFNTVEIDTRDQEATA